MGASSFKRGLTRYGLLLVRVMAVLLAVVFAANLILGRPFVDALLFSLALAVGLTPQILPAIVAISLSVGARKMAERRVIVKRLDAIEDFGAMTVLLTDKTGTITTGSVDLKDALDLSGQPDDEVRRLARLNAGLQHGFTNPMDQAIMAGVPAPEDRLRIAEVPYDSVSTTTRSSWPGRPPCGVRARKWFLKPPTGGTGRPTCWPRLVRWCTWRIRWASRVSHIAG